MYHEVSTVSLYKTLFKMPINIIILNSRIMLLELKLKHMKRRFPGQFRANQIEYEAKSDTYL